MAEIRFRFLSKAQTDLLKKVKSYSDTTSWNITEKRFVCFLDILGFKELVLRNSHVDVFAKLSEISDLKRNLNPKITDKDFSNDGIYPIELVTFSDSIILFSKNDTVETFKLFLETINWIFARIIEMEIPIKGAFAHGEISIDDTKQIYFGQALIDSYQLQEDVDYFGVVADCSIDKYIEDNNVDDIDSFIFEAKTPLKSGKISHLNLRYFPFIVYNENQKMYDFFTKFKYSASGKPRKYLENSVDFYNFYLENNSISQFSTTK